MSRRHDYFKLRLRELGLYDSDSDYGGLIGKTVEGLSEVFSKQGHSGESARLTMELLNLLMMEWSEDCHDPKVEVEED